MSYSVYNKSRNEVDCRFFAINTINADLFNTLFFINVAIDGFNCDTMEVTPFIKVNGNLDKIKLHGYVNITNSVDSNKLKLN